MSEDFIASLAQASGDITVPAGIHRGSVQISSALTLRGDRFAVFDGNGAHSILIIDAPGQVVTIEDVLFVNGGGHVGGAIHVNAGTLVVKRCTFRRGAARRFGGGAIYSRGEHLVVRQCRFEENVGQQGGALLLDDEADALVCDSVFMFNAALSGGAVRLREGARARLVGCTLASNRAISSPEAPGVGGSFSLTSTPSRVPSLVIENCVIGVHAENAGELSIDRSDGALPVPIAIRHSLIPPSLRDIADATCRVGALEVSASLVPARGCEADGLADPAVWREVASTDYSGAERDLAVGAFSTRANSSH